LQKADYIKGAYVHKKMVTNPGENRHLFYHIMSPDPHFAKKSELCTIIKLKSLAKTFK